MKGTFSRNSNGNIKKTTKIVNVPCNQMEQTQAQQQTQAKAKEKQQVQQQVQEQQQTQTQEKQQTQGKTIYTQEKSPFEMLNTKRK